MYRKAVVIINPSSGREKAETKKARLKEVLETIAVDFSFKETTKAGDAVLFAEEAVASQADLVVCVGGDGTVNEVITGLARVKEPPILGIIPMGTVNSLALALDLPLEADAAIKNLTSKKIQKIDIGQVNDQFFTNVIAIGDIATGIQDTSVSEKSLLGPLAYALQGVREYVNQDSFKIELRINDHIWSGDAMIVAAVMTDVLGSVKKVFNDAKVDDGKMQLIVIKDLSVGKVLTMLPELITKNYSESSNVVHWTVSEATVVGSTALNGNIDGDEGPKLPWHLKVLPQKIRVIIPKT